MFIAVDKGTSALDAAQNVSLDAAPPSTGGTSPGREPAPGSAEQFLGMFGGRR